MAEPRGWGRTSWREIDWRSHRRWLRVGGAQVNVVELGEGPPVVLIHGLSGNWQNWLEVMPGLALDHRVVALDLPGFGHSEMPDGGVSIPVFADTVDAVLDQLGIGAAALVGNSMGGFIAAEIAIRHPARAERLALVSAAALWNERRRARPLVVASKVTRLYSPLVAQQWESIARRRRLRVRALASGGLRHPGRVSPALAYELLSGAGKPAFVPALQALYDYRIRDRLPEIACPTLVVWGSEDPLVPLKHAFEYEALIPRARVVVFRDTGHVPMVEEPERFLATIRDFLAEEHLGAVEEPAAEVR
jgi:pimeloyl-ACP methyl ester carboxylesterase